MKHLEFEKLLNGFESLEPPAAEAQAEARREISAHLQACAECAARAAGLESFFRYVQADKNAEVSQADTAALLNIFRPKRNVSDAAAGGRLRRGGTKIKTLLASLVFDDWQTVLHERLAFSTDSRQMLYRAGQVEVDLRLHFTGGNCRVSGQVFSECASSDAPANAELSSAETSEKVFLNDCGEFVFPALKEGIYNFRLDSGETTIEIENLSLVN